MEKPNQEEVVSVLRAKGHLPVTIKSKSQSRWNFVRTKNAALNPKETLSVVSGLSDLLESGVSVDEALTILSKETEGSKNQLRLVQHIITEVRGGKSLSSAFVSSKMLPDRSTGPLISLIKAGEKSGQLANNLTQATTLLQNSMDANKKLQSALSYPLVVLFVAFFTLIFMGAVIAPAFRDLFQDLGKELPGTLSLLISFVDLVPLFLAALLAAVLAGHIQSSLVLKLKDWFSGLLLKIPMISSAIMYNEIANFSFLLANLLKGGVEIVTALRLARDGVTNKIIGKSLEQVSKEVENGRNLSVAVLKIDNIPAVFVQMVRIGEAKGNLSPMLHRSADILRSDLEEKIERLTAYLPAVLICLLGGIIGLLVSSIFGAILDINDLAI
ncbi:type II secretion system F family protein [Kordiimonas aquimaris]|uniref:type II secretion system F family protein n=1 Tax=Kordiimonas aquimaris TaxID=707591 RepID=UPI0021D0B5CC|nr:type II secretion system F family protein [Kordiimonas aquimaris]